MSDGVKRDVYQFNYWPSSQLCMDCKHGKFVMGEDLPPSTYTCSEGIALGPCESNCPFFKEEEKEETFLANDPIEW